MKRILVPLCVLIAVPLMLQLSHSTIVHAGLPLQARVLPLTHFDSSAPLSQMRFMPHRPLTSAHFSKRLLPSNGLVANAKPSSQEDNALDEGPSGGATMPRSTGWAGINAAASNCNCLPPDPNGDVGTNHYFQTVNVAFQVYDKSGSVIVPTTQNNVLFTGFGGVCETTNQGDPVVLYDQLADRWFFSQFAFDLDPANNPIPPFLQCVAVSQTGDPAGAWNRYSWDFTSAGFNDYAKFGVMPDGYYMTTNLFDQSLTSWVGQGVVAFERAKMLSGQAAQNVFYNLGPTDWGGMLPADLDGSTPPPDSGDYFIEAQDSDWDPVHIPVDRLELFKLVPNWTNTANSTLTNTANLATRVFNGTLCSFARSCIPQKGTSSRLDAIAGQTMFRVQYRNFGSYGSLVTNISASIHGNSGIRWYELHVVNGVPSIYQEGTYAPRDNTFRWLGSAAMDKQGNLAIGYSKSSAAMYPGIWYAGRLANDRLHKLTLGERQMKGGRGAQTSFFSRWGDYSMLAVDPSDDCTFWYTNEFFKTTSSANWQTWIGKFKFPGCS